MKTLVRAISDPSAISEIGAELDDFIVTNTKNPFMLATFLKGRMEWALTQAMNPVVLVFFVDKKIRGVVPLLFKKKYGIRLANFLFTYEFSTDFIFENQYKEAFIRFTLHFIFKRSQLVYLILPLESSNLNILTQMCEINGVTCRRNAELPIHHRILPVDCSWGAFLKSKSGSSRRKFNSITKKIENNGDWTVSCAENGANEQGVFEQIMAVEESCWKQNWRMQNHMFKVDDVLFNLWFFSGALSKINPDFKRSVWLLYFKGNITAYSLVFQYKGTAYMAKTSYNEQFRHFYPGIYINHIALQGLFDSERTRMIDFMTDLPFHERWTHKRLLRVRLLLSKGVLSDLLAFLIQCPQMRRIIWFLAPELVKQIA